MKQGLQNIDNHLKDVFHAWGEEPPTELWQEIVDLRSQKREKQKQQKRKILLTFLAGSLCMVLLLLPFISFEGLTSKKKRRVYGIDTKVMPWNSEYHLPQKTEQYPVSEDPVLKVDQQQGIGNNKGIHKVQPVITTIENRKSALSGSIIKEVEKADNEFSYNYEDLSEVRYSYTNYGEKLGDYINKEQLKPETLKALPVRVPFMFISAGLGGFNQQNKVRSMVPEATAHKDAGENYSQWLSNPSSGMTFNIEAIKSWGKGWQFQTALNYTTTLQHIQYNYVYREIPVILNGQIAGYFTLPDSEKSVYNSTTNIKTQSVSVRIGAGRQFRLNTFWSLGLYGYIAPVLYTNVSGNLLDINKNTQEKMGDLIRSKSIPAGFSARVSHSLPGGTSMFMEYGKMFSRYETVISRTKILTNSVNNRITLGFQYPITIKKTTRLPQIKDTL